MNYWNKEDAIDITKANDAFLKLKSQFEKDVLELQQSFHKDSAAFHHMQDYMNYVDDAYSETLEPASWEADLEDISPEPAILDDQHYGLKTGRG